MSTMTKLEFRKQLDALRAELQKQIEAEVHGIDSDPKAIVERRKAVLDPITGFEYFVNHYFPHYVRSKSQSQLHVYLFKRLPEIIRTEKSCHDAIAAPRGEAKSTLVTQLFNLWCVITGNKKYIVIVMDSIDQAYPMLEAIKAELEFNVRLHTDFPGACFAGRVWQVGTIVTNNNIKVQVAGSGKKLRGLRHGPHRPDLVVLDDIENDEQVANPEQRDKVERWVKKTILPLGAAGEKSDVVYIGTILHYDSVLNRMLNNPFWRNQKFKAMLSWPERMDMWEEWEQFYRNQGEEIATQFYLQNKAEMTRGALTSWQARDVLALMTIRASDGHDTFDCEYQNDPVAGDSAIFNNVIQFWVQRDDDWIFYGACDPSLGKAGNRRDPSALLVGGYNRRTGVLDVVEAKIIKRLPDKIISDVIALQQQYKCQLWGIETIQFQEFLKTELVKRSAILGCPVPARGIKPNTDKLLRIESLQPHMANGLIRLHSSQNTLIEQLRHFPKADHDDGPDALQMLWMLATTSNTAIEWQSISQADMRNKWR